MYNINIATPKNIKNLYRLYQPPQSSYYIVLSLFFFCRGFSIFSKGLPKQPAQHVLSGKNYKGCMMLKYCTWSISCQKKLVWGMSPDFFFCQGFQRFCPTLRQCFACHWIGWRKIFTGNDFRRGWEKPKSSCEAASAVEVPGGKWTQKSMAACVTGQRTLKWLLWSIMIYYVSLHYKDKSVSSLRLCQ